VKEPMIIPYQTYEFTLKAEDEIHLPAYKGSAFRGGFGAAFRKVVCALRRTECGACLLRLRCPYAYIFETFPDRQTEVLRAGTHEKAPHPFVIEPPLEQTRVYEPGQSLSFNLILIGRGNDYLPYFVYAFEELGKMGIGRGRGRYRLERIEINNEQIYEASLRRRNSPIVKLFDKVDLGKSPFKHPLTKNSQKTKKAVDGLPQR